MFKSPFIIIRFVFFCGAVILAGCNAPRDNPLDPESDHYRPPVSNEISLTGRARSVHISRNFPTEDSYSVIVELRGEDSNSLDSAWVSYNGRPAVTLARQASGWWASLFASSYFGNDPRLGGVIGRPFVFTALRGSQLYSLGPTYLFRVIEAVPVALSPSHHDTVGTNPELTWQAFSASFPFAYRPSVFNITDGFETLVWTSPDLPSTVLTTTLPQELAAGSYYWTLTVIDSFANSSRSKEAAFEVVN